MPASRAVPRAAARAHASADGTRRAIAIACFFLSGCAGLVYEVCWIRRASLGFGSTTYALSTVLAVFFSGLALGSRIIGRASTKAASPLALYAALEVAVALLALATIPGFEFAERLYGDVYRAFGTAPLVHGLLRFLLIAALLVPPAVLMGGTLPLFCRQFATRRGRIAESVGFLYAVNTLGAAAGCALTGLVLLPALGLRGSMILGAALSLTSGVAVWLVARHAPWAPEPSESPAPRGSASSPTPIGPTPAHAPARVALGVFVSGFVVLGYEVLWPRYLSLLVANDVYRYTLTLTLVLAGIVFGSLVASRLFDGRLPRGAAFGTLQALFGLMVLGTALIPPAAWDRMGSELLVYALLLLPPATLSGALFPLAARMVVRDPAEVGSAVGQITLVNTAGGIAGSLLIGFWALPRFGLEPCLLFLTGTSVASGALAILFLDPAPMRRSRLMLTAAAVLLWLAIPRVARTRVPADFLAGAAELIDYREGLESNLAVVRRDGHRVLEIDRWWQGQDNKTHQVMAAHLPLVLHPLPRRVLVVGVGTGQTASRVLMHDVERLDCIDIEPAVFDLIRPHFDSAWMDDPRVRMLREDGRNFIGHSAERYDVISLEVGQVFRPGIAAFYTSEFYGRARARLMPGGMLAQFVPLPFFDPATFRSVIASFLGVFPQSTLWYNTSELLLVGVNAERFDLGKARLGALTSNRRVHEDLRYSPWGGSEYWLHRPEVFIGGLLAGPAELAALVANAPRFRDDRPVLEYATHHAEAHVTNDLENLELLRRHLAPLDAGSPPALSPEVAAAAGRVREQNLRDVPAEAMLRRVEELESPESAPELVALLERAVVQHPENLNARRSLADALILVHRLDEARAHYARVIALDPDQALAHRGLGVALHHEGRLAEAIVEYRAALRADSTDAQAHNNLGAVFAAQAQFPAALEHLGAAVRLRPGYRDAIENLGKVRAQMIARGETPAPR